MDLTPPSSFIENGSESFKDDSEFKFEQWEKEASNREKEVTKNNSF
jgi:hypothetical protein